MMAKRPELRYQTPAEALAALYPMVDDRIEPPTEDEIVPLCKAASGPATHRSRAHTIATLSTMNRQAGFGPPNVPPAGPGLTPRPVTLPPAAHAGPRPASRISAAKTMADTPTLGSAATVYSGIHVSNPVSDSADPVLDPAVEPAELAPALSTGVNAAALPGDDRQEDLQSVQGENPAKALSQAAATEEATNRTLRNS